MDKKPQLYEIVADSKALQPSNEQLEDALSQSRDYWHHIAEAAYHFHDIGVPPEYVNPYHMLSKVPKMREDQHNTYAMYLGGSPTQALCLQTSANWQLAEPAKCERVRGTREQIVLLQFGTKAAVPYMLNGCGFSRWIGTADEVSVGTKYLGILTLGWCYILSARLVEIQGNGATMRYTASRATGYRRTATRRGSIDIGQADDESVSWWSAILAPGEGWKAIIKQCDEGEFFAPWSLTCACQEPLSFTWQNKKSTEVSDNCPISSRRAFEHLSQFAILHNLGSQFPVALAAAMMVPTHSHHGKTLQLPCPTSTGPQSPAISPTSIPSEWAVLYKNLDYYMTLSCKPEAIMSSLCGAFWEPGVPCNLVSPWLHPIMNEIPEQETISRTPGLYTEILAIICCIRRPTISALWLGAAATGLTPVILRRIRRGRPALDPVAFAWTGSPQGFTDIAGSGPYLIGEAREEVWRADVWRLLHLPPAEEDEFSFRYRPDTPWEPCGKMRKKDCVLRVASHLECPRHQLVYHHLNWELEGNMVIQDEGFSTIANPTPPVFDIASLQLRNLFPSPPQPFDQGASEEASIEIFFWLLVNGEGFPSEDFYKDEWLEGLDEGDSDEEVPAEDNNDSDTTRKKWHSSLEKWLATIS